MELTRRQFAAAALFAIGAFALTGCDGDAQPSGAASSSQQSLDLTGTWKQVNSSDPDNTWMEAVVGGDSIAVNWVMDGGTVTALYWRGTYAAPSGSVNEYSWTSNSTMDPAIFNALASQDETKDFVYANGRLAWHQSAQGVTTTVECEKV